MASAEPRVVRVLLVEDDEIDALLLAERLTAGTDTAGPRRYEIARAETCAEAVAAVTAEVPDVVLLDLHLPDSVGIQTVRRFRASHPEVAVVVLTGLDDQETARAAVLAGAQDYLPKNSVDVAAIDRAIRHARDRHRLHAQLDREAGGRLAAERRFRSLFDNHPDAVVELGSDGRCVRANARATAVLGPVSIGQPFERSFASADRPAVERLIAGALAGQADCTLVGLPATSDDHRVLLTTIPLRAAESQAPSGVFVVCQTAAGLEQALDSRPAAAPAARHLAAIVRTADLAIVSVDLDGRIATWNPGAERLYGVAAEHAVGRSYAAVVGMQPHDLAERLELVLRGDCVVVGDTVEAAGPGGGAVQSTYSPLIDEGGSIAGWSVISRDVGPIQAAERQLRRSEQRFRALAENTEDVIYLLRRDPEPYFDYISPAAATVLGYSPVSWYRDRSFTDRIIHDDDRELLADARRKPGTAQRHTIRLRRSDGEWRWFDWRSTPVRDDDGCVVGTQGSLRDVTDSRHAARQLEAYAVELEGALEELQRAGRLRDELLSVVSHELRTPLTPIVGFSALILQHWGHRLEPDQRRIIEVIARNASRMLRLVDELLDLSRLAAGTLDADPEPVPVVSSVETLAADLGIPADEVTITGQAGLYARVDRRQFDQIIANLLQNASRYGRPPIHVDIGTAQGDVEIRVSDHGDGVPADFLPQLFEKFAQASTGDRRTAAGLGLGLYLVRRLVELNDGDVRYERNEPTGACFVVRLPSSTSAGVDATSGPATRLVGSLGSSRTERSTDEPVAERPIPHELPAAVADAAALVRRQLVGVTQPEQVLHAATRLLIHAETADDAVGVLLAVIARLGGATVPAAEADDRAIPVDVSLGTTGPLLPVADSASTERMVLEAHLPAMVEDARRIVDLRRAAAASGHRSTGEDAADPWSAMTPLQVIASLAHDLRTPAAASRIAVELAQDAAGAPPDPALLDSVARNAARVERLADELLHLIRFDERPYDLREIPMGALLDRAADDARCATGRRIDVRLDPDLPPALADEDAQLRILDNLLTNAVRYSPEGAPVDVSVTSAGDMLQVAVHDHGPGLRRDELDRLFRPFSRLERHREAGIDGVGLGLYVTRRLVEGQGGRIDVRSGAGCGTTFLYTVPVAATSAPARVQLETHEV